MSETGKPEEKQINFGFTDQNVYTTLKRKKIKKKKKRLKGNIKSPGKWKNRARNQDYVIRDRHQEVNQWKIAKMRVLLQNKIFRD